MHTSSRYLQRFDDTILFGMSTLIVMIVLLVAVIAMFLFKLSAVNVLSKTRFFSKNELYESDLARKVMDGRNHHSREIYPDNYHSILSYECDVVPILVNLSEEPG